MKATSDLHIRVKSSERSDDREGATVYCISTIVADETMPLQKALAVRLLQEAGYSANITKGKWFLVHDGYGCPRIFSSNPQTIAVSFSYQAEKMWAAVAETTHLGIDVESPDNFPAHYPYNKVFSSYEFGQVMAFCQDKADAAALLWSCKEAAVKHLGLGFRRFPPSEVQALSCRQDDEGNLSLAMKTPSANLRVTARREDEYWLAFSTSNTVCRFVAVA